MREIGRERWIDLDMTASIGTARRGVFDPLASTVDYGIGSNWYIVLFNIIGNSNTPNSGLTHRLDANFSDLQYLEHPYNTRRDNLELNTVTTNAHTSWNGFCKLH